MPCLLGVSMMNNHICGSKVPQNTHFGGLNRHFKPNMRKKSNSYIFRPVYQIDMKFDGQLRPATETSWVVSYGGKTIPRWRTATILKIVISSQEIIRFWWNFVHSSRFWTGWTSRDQKWKKLHWTDSEFDRMFFLLVTLFMIVMSDGCMRFPISIRQ